MWVSNTATAVMLYPMALSVIEYGDPDAAEAGPFASALLLGLAYGANIGGLATLIGTPPNALLAGFMAENYGREIGFAQWMLLGVPLVAVGLPLSWVLLVRMLFPLARGAAGVVRSSAAALRIDAAALGPLSTAERRVGGITALTALAWVTRPLLDELLPGVSDAGIAITGALLLFVIPAGGGASANLLSWDDAEKIPWGVLILFGGGLSLASAISDTGLADWIGHVLAPLQALPLWLVALAVTAVVLFLTEVTSNTATAAAFLPVVGAMAVGMGADPLRLALPAALAASCAFMLPVATPPNAIVFASGRLSIAQMARAGIWLNLLMLVLINLAVAMVGMRVFGTR